MVSPERQEPLDTPHEAPESARATHTDVQEGEKAIPATDRVPRLPRSGVEIEELLESGGEVADLNRAVDDLSKLTAQIADDVMTSAVKKALSDS